jgi:O-methyltransferase involved in polyketide biosynthesis
VASKYTASQEIFPVTDNSSASGKQLSAAIDTRRPHSARIWNYWLGGKDNYPVDREVGDEFLAIFPGQAEVARQARAFLGRAVRYLAGEAGIRQFLDVGTGLPTANNTHEVAQRVAPQSRIVYVDNDPLVLAHARALLTSSPQGACDYIDSDLHDPGTILTEAARTLDFTRPVALIMLGILGHIADDDRPKDIVARLVNPLPAGSYLVIADGTNVLEGQGGGDAGDESARARAYQHYAEAGGIPYRPRTPEAIADFFEGLELIDPGVVSISRWRPEPTPFGDPAEVDAFGGVARKP